MSPSTSSRPQRANVSSRLNEYPKSTARVKYSLGAVEPVRGQQLLGPEDGQGVEQLGADLVLSAVAARGGEERDAMALAFREQRQQRVVLVVRMRRDHQERAAAVELAQDKT